MAIQYDTFRVRKHNYIPHITDEELVAIVQREMKKLIGDAQGEKDLKKSKDYEKDVQNAAKAGAFDYVPFLTDEEWTTFGARDVKKWMRVARDESRVEEAKRHEKNAQDAASVVGFNYVPQLTEEEWKAITRREVEKLMEDARSKDDVKEAKSYEKDAQNVARAGGFNYVPRLTREELNAVGQREVDRWMGYARDESRRIAAKSDEKYAQEVAIAARLNYVPQLTKEERTAIIIREVEQWISLARDEDSVKKAKSYEKYAQRAAARAGKFDHVPRLTHEELTTVGKRDVERSMRITREKCNNTKEAKRNEKHARKVAIVAGLDYVPQLTKEEWAAIAQRETNQLAPKPIASTHKMRLRSADKAPNPNPIASTHKMRLRSADKLL